MTSMEFAIPGAEQAPRNTRPRRGIRNDSPILIDLSLAGTAAYWTTRWGAA